MLRLDRTHAACGPVERQRIAFAAFRGPQIPCLLQEFNETRVVHAQDRIDAKIVRCCDFTECCLAHCCQYQLGALGRFIAWHQFAVRQLKLAAMQLVIFAVDR